MAGKFKRRKRDLSGMKNRPKSGAKPTHGGYSEVARYRERKLDRRRSDDKALLAWQNAIVTDLEARK